MDFDAAFDRLIGHEGAMQRPRILRCVDYGVNRRLRVREVETHGSERSLAALNYVCSGRGTYKVTRSMMCWQASPTEVIV